MATLLLGTTIGGYAAIHAGNIASQSVNYASSAGSVAWSNVTGKPTLLSQFTNDLGNYGSWITASYLDDYTRGAYRVISDYGGNTTWYIRGDGQFIWGRSHDWSYSVRLSLPSGSQNNTTWAYIGQQDSNAASGTWRGLRVRKYNSGNVDGDLSAGAFYIGDTRKDQNWDTAYGWGNHASAGYATTSYVTTQIANLVNSAPSTLDTLNELATALGNDAAFSTTVTTALGNRLRIDTGSQGLNSTQQGYGRTNLGLGTAATYAAGDFALASHNHSGTYLPLGGSWVADFASYGFTRQAGYSVVGGEWVLMSNNAQVSTLIDGSYFAGENGGFYSLNNANSYISRKGFYNDGTYANFNTGVIVGGDLIPTHAFYPGYNNGAAGSQTSYYFYGNTSNSGIRTNANLLVNSDIYLGIRGQWLSTYLNQNVRTDSSPTFSSIYLSGSQLTSSMVNGLSNMLGVTTLPYSCDIVVNGDPDRFYAVQFWGGDQDVWRRIIIKRGYGEQAPWDPIGTGVHHGGLLLDWEGNFGGWGGAEYADRIRVFNESYTNVCADMYIYSHSMGYVFMLRGGGAVYHLFSDQPINGFYQSGSPDIAYSTSTLLYDDQWSGTNQYDVPAPTPLTLAQVNSSRIDGLRTKKQSLLDGRYLRQGVDISGIGTITATNFIANNAFYLNGTSYYLNSTNGGIYTNARFESANSMVSPTFTASGSRGFYVNSGGASYFEANSSSNWAWLRLSNNGNVSWDIASYNGGSLEFRPYGSGTNATSIGLDGVMTIQAASDPKLILRVPSGDSSEWNYINFVGSNGVRDAYFGTDGSGNPTWYRDDNGVNIGLGASGATVNGALIASQSWVTSQGYITSVGSHNHDDRYYTESESDFRFLRYRGINAESDFQNFQNETGEVRFDQINNYSNLSNPPGGYNYGGVLSMRGDNFGFQIWGSHTGDLFYKTQWSGDNYTGWRSIITALNIGSQSVNYATNSGTTSQRTFDYIYATSYLESAGAVYGTIFYDNNDRNYYVDPNGMSKQVQLTNLGTYGSSASNARNHFVQYNAGTAGPANGWIAAAFGDASANRVVIGQWNNNTQATIGSHNGNLNDWAALGYVATEHIFYAPSWTSSEKFKINTDGVYAPAYRGNANVGGTGTATWHPDGIYCGSTMWQYGAQYKNGSGIYDVGEIRLNGGPYMMTYNSRNMIVKGSDSGDVGILGRGSSNQFGFQLYGAGNSDYGFLASAWGAWDIKKTSGGNLYTNDNTTYYLNPSATSFVNTLLGNYIRSYGNLRVDSNIYLDQQYGSSLVGAYSSTRYQGIFAMGDSYKLAIDGSSTGSLYGLAWSHPNAGGVAGNLNTHGLLVMENGGFLAAISGSIRARDDVRAPYFYGGYSTRVGEIWGYGGLYRSSGDMMFGTENGGWRFHYANVQKVYIGSDGNIWMAWAGSYISTLLDAKQNANTAINTSNIGSQSVSYASSAGTASNLQGYSAAGLINGSRGIHSGSDFPNGTLVRTDINANGWAGDSFVMEVSGKSYDSTHTPFKLVMQGYLYADTVINVSAMSYGSYFPGPVRVMNLDGNLAFWWPRGSYWNSFEVHVREAGGSGWNRATNIENSDLPGQATKVVAITPVQVVHSNNIGSQSVSYANNSGTVSGLSVHGGRNNETNKIVRTDANGYLQTGWINTPSGSFGSAITKIYCSDDDYIRYQTPSTFISTLGLITTSSIGSQSVSFASSTDLVNGFAATRDNARTGQGVRAWYDWNYDGNYANGITIGSNPGDQNYGFQLFQYMWDDRLYMRRYNYGWQGYRILLDNAANPYAYDMNQYVRTSDSVTFTNVYNYGWFRNYNNLEGLYNQNNGNHFYSNGSGSWGITGAGGNVELQFRSNHQSTLRGYVYGDTSSNFGLLNDQGGWSVRCYSGGGYGGALSGSWTASGDLIAYSDERVKTNISTIENALDKVLSLRGVTYERTDGDDHSQKIGVIAQEIQKILPQVVHEQDNGMLGVSYGNIVGVLIEAIKEQQKEIEELKTKLN